MVSRRYSLLRPDILDTPNGNDSHVTTLATASRTTQPSSSSYQLPGSTFSALHLPFPRSLFRSNSQPHVWVHTFTCTHTFTHTHTLHTYSFIIKKGKPNTLWADKRRQIAGGFAVDEEVCLPFKRHNTMRRVVDMPHIAHLPNTHHPTTDKTHTRHIVWKSFCSHFPGDACGGFVPRLAFNSLNPFPRVRRNHQTVKMGNPFRSGASCSACILSAHISE